MRFVILMISLSLFAGCGPMLSPMAPRLDVETQQKVDQIWNNLLTPVDRVDRQTLLDTNVSYWMYTLGVDRLHMTSEKYFSGGAAIMVIDCDRANPDSDQYTITIVDHQGKTVRRERYSRADVEESSKMMTGIDNSIRSTTQPTTQPSTQPATTQAESEEIRKLRVEIERRHTAVEAATQPARLTPG